MKPPSTRTVTVFSDSSAGKGESVLGDDSFLGFVSASADMTREAPELRVSWQQCEAQRRDFANMMMEYISGEKVVRETVLALWAMVSMGQALRFQGILTRFRARFSGSARST